MLTKEKLALGLLGGTRAAAGASKLLLEGDMAPGGFLLEGDAATGYLLLEGDMA